MHEALTIEYDFETRTGTVEFADDHQVSIQQVVSYFMDASDGKVETIHIFRGGKLENELRRPFSGA
jgi:hypothetical protein